MLARGMLVLLAATAGLAVGGTQGEAVPDGPGRIAFVSTREGSAQVYLMNADGSLTRLTSPPGEPRRPRLARTATASPSTQTKTSIPRST